MRRVARSIQHAHEVEPTWQAAEREVCLRRTREGLEDKALARQVKDLQTKELLAEDLDTAFAGEVAKLPFLMLFILRSWCRCRLRLWLGIRHGYWCRLRSRLGRRLWLRCRSRSRCWLRLRQLLSCRLGWTNLGGRWCLWASSCDEGHVDGWLVRCPRAVHRLALCDLCYDAVGSTWDEVAEKLLGEGIALDDVGHRVEARVGEGTCRTECTAPRRGILEVEAYRAERRVG